MMVIGSHKMKVMAAVLTLGAFFFWALSQQPPEPADHLQTRPSRKSRAQVAEKREEEASAARLEVLEEKVSPVGQVAETEPPTEPQTEPKDDVDGRCGSEYLQAVCDCIGNRLYCSADGWCGDSEAHKAGNNRKFDCPHAHKISQVRAEHAHKISEDDADSPVEEDGDEYIDDITPVSNNQSKAPDRNTLIASLSTSGAGYFGAGMDEERKCAIVPAQWSTRTAIAACNALCDQLGECGGVNLKPWSSCAQDVLICCPRSPAFCKDPKNKKYCDDPRNDKQAQLRIWLRQRHDEQTSVCLAKRPSPGNCSLHDTHY